MKVLTISSQGSDIEAVEVQIVSDAPTGCMMKIAGTAVPNGFLKCEGQAVDRQTYPDLFASISTSFGEGDGSTTFNVPRIGDYIRGNDVVMIYCIKK